MTETDNSNPGEPTSKQSDSMNANSFDSERVAKTTQSSEIESAENRPPSNRAKEKLLPKIISFDDLAICGEEIWIENNSQIYRLRRTRQGKLILTK